MANEQMINTEEFDTYVKDLMAEFKVPGAAVALVTDSVSTTRTFNLAGFVPINENTRFAVAPTKLVNALAVARALRDAGYEQGFNTRVRDILPDFKLSNETTADNCTLSRTEGVPHTGELGELPLAYSNMIQQQSLLIIEKLTGQTYQDYVRSVILDPLEMQSTGWSVSEVGEDMATGWQMRHIPTGVDEQLMKITHPYDALGEQMGIACFRMVSTIGDMAELLNYLPKDPAWKEMAVPDQDPAKTIPQGNLLSQDMFGIGTMTYHIGQHVFGGHTGKCAGFRTYIMRNEKLNYGVSVLTNSTEGMELALCIEAWVLSKITGDHNIKDQVYREVLQRQQARHDLIIQDHIAIEATDDEKLLGTFSSPAFGTISLDEASNIPQRPACNLFDIPWMSHLYGQNRYLVTSVGEGRFEGCIEWKPDADQDQSRGEAVHGWPFVVQVKGDEIEVYGMGIGLPGTIFAAPPAVFTQVHPEVVDQ